MVAHDIPLDKAELLSVILESILYGFSLLMFAATIWVLFNRRSSDRINIKMLVAACILWLLSTVHVVIHIIRVMDGLILEGPSYPGGPNAFFGNVLHWTFMWKNYMYISQSLIGDMVVIYRCYAVWQSILVIVFPVMLWIATLVCASAGVYIALNALAGLFDGVLAQWITGFWSMALSTNLLATGLLAWRIWHVDRESRRLRGQRKSYLRHVLRIVLDAGLMYSLTLLTAMSCYLEKTNAQYVTLDMVTPVIAITFYMVIIRVGLASNADRTRKHISLDCTLSSTGQGTYADRRNGTQLRVASLSQNKVEAGVASIELVPPIKLDPRLRDEIKIDGVTLDG